MDYKKRCSDCACLISKNGVWCCDECFGQKCEDIDECPEGMGEEELAKLDELDKVKISHGASAETKEKKERKPKTVKISDEKIKIFNTVLDILEEKYVVNVLKDNKLIEINYNGKKFKLDLTETREKKPN